MVASTCFHSPYVCPLCGSYGSVRQVANNTVFSGTFPVLYCDTCELYFLAPSPGQEFLDTFYREQYFAEARRSDFHYRLKSIFSRFRAASQLRYLEKQFDAGSQGAVLEIGSADGTFLSLFRRWGWTVRGLEYNDYMIKKARSRYGISLEPRDVFELDATEFKYDCIALLHVLEHMPEPHRVLAHCAGLLREGGRVFIELPHSPEPDDVSPEMLEWYVGTTHLTNYRPKSLEALCRKAGMRVLSLDRFFYPVSSPLSSSSREVGRILMNGTLQTVNPLHVAALILTVSTMYVRYLLGGDPLSHIPLGTGWRGVGDNLRIVLERI